MIEGCDRLRNDEVLCDAVWIWSLVPCEENLCRARLTARCSVTARQYAACLRGPCQTPSGGNTFFLLCNYPSSFQPIITQSNFSLDISFLFVVSFQNGTLAVSYTSHVQNSVYSTWCVLTVRAKAKPHFAYWRSLSMYKCKIAPFLPCNLLWLAVFYFTIASHGNCSQVCFSPAFWTCGLVWLTGRQAALLARCVYAGAGHSGHTALRSILEGLFRAAYTAV